MSRLDAGISEHGLKAEFQYQPAETRRLTDTDGSPGVAVGRDPCFAPPVRLAGGARPRLTVAPMFQDG